MSDNAYIVRLDPAVWPQTAPPGSQITIGMAITNIDIQTRNTRVVMLTHVDGRVYLVFDQYKYLHPQESTTYYVHLIMPDTGFVLKAQGWYYTSIIQYDWWDIGDEEEVYIFTSVAEFRNLSVTNYNGG